MSGSAVVCRCGAPLARRHEGGRLHPCEGVRSFYDPNGRLGPFLGLTCPACGKRRDYRVGGAGEKRGAAGRRGRVAPPVVRGL